MKKKIFLVMLSSLLLSVSPTNLWINSNSAIATTAIDSRMELYSNQTGYRYMRKNGKVWKRLWSYTYKRWEEPHWTLVN